MFSLRILQSLSVLSLFALAACTDDKGGLETGDIGVDEDGDGYVAGEDPGEDCDDANSQIHPGETEACDGVDNDCDGELDDGLDTTPWYEDHDADGYGDEATEIQACAGPDHYVSVAGDCDDRDADYHPGATEDDCADPNDYNCDGSVGYADADGDRYPACLECDDADASAYPGATETCDGVDDDCDGEIDDNADGAATWYIDYDTDGYGSDRYAQVACDQPEGFVDNQDDCNDQNDDAYPGADEVCDGDDTDCDGEVDEDSAVDASTWYADADADGYGVPEDSRVACEQPDGYAPNDDDCDDDAPEVNPGQDEICDDIDDDCDGEVDEDSAVDASVWYADADADGYGLDAFTTVSCEQPESYAAEGGDCYDDGTEVGAAINPDGVEICDEFDNDCDGSTDETGAEGAVEWYADADDDGFGSPDGATSSCEQPPGYVSNTLDCDDEDEEVNPDGDERCDDGVDSDCDGLADGCWTTASDADTILYGEAANSSLGNAIGPAGDVNGDDLADVVLGAYRYDGDATDVGRVYLAYGPISGGERSVGTADVIIEGDGTSDNDDRAGTSVAGGGDLDGDDLDDLLIGAIRYPLARPKNRGAVYGLFGPLTGSLDLATDYDFRMVGENQFDRIGTGVLGDLDMDGDGALDVALGTNGLDTGGDGAGGVYIVFGPFDTTSTDFNVGLADVLLYGEAASDALGADLASVGDMDGDGLAELAAGNKERDDDTAGADAGCVYLVSDPASGETVVSDAALTVAGEAAEDHAGTSVSSAGDLNDDGYGDLAVGAPGSDAAGGDAGKAYLLFGPVTYTSLAEAEIALLGETALDALGTAVAGGGDNDGDGALDLLLTATAADDAADDGGAAYLFLGPWTAGTLTVSDAYATIYGDSVDGNLGSRAAFSGDTDGSGNDDLMISADNDNRGGASSGAVFFFDELGL